MLCWLGVWCVLSFFATRAENQGSIFCMKICGFPFRVIFVNGKEASPNSLVFFPSISAAAFVIVTVAGSCTGARLTRLDEADLSEGVNVGDSRI